MRLKANLKINISCVLWILKFYRKVLKCSFNLTLMYGLKSSYEPFCSNFTLSLKMTKTLGELPKLRSGLKMEFGVCGLF